MRNLLLSIFFVISVSGFAQENSCKLRIGTNLSGLSDWMTEMPFVDMMHHARTWGTRNRHWIGGDAQNHWNTDLNDYIDKDENGYPLELPFYHDDLALEDSQMVFTVWAILDAWEPGIYTFLYDGEGEFDFRADGKVLKNEAGRAEVEIIRSNNSFLELVITRSKKGNHLRNFRLLMPDHETTYTEQPFNPLYLDRLQDFAALRFMDWGQTNNWGESAAWLNFDEPEDTILVPWSQRSQMNDYTWSHNKGVPYEMMCDLCNATSKDLWVCVPHNASNEYIAEMANLIKERLNPDLKIYAEYSNEIWNWMFGQTHWLNKFFCEGRGISWPEGIVDNIQRNLDVWNEVFADHPNRLITVAGGQTSWQNVTNRIVLNLKEGSFNALNITGYFGLSSEADAALDQLGSAATASDVAFWVRKYMLEEEITYIQNQYELAKQLNIPIVFYEAGQHITPHPFGEEPTYAQALLDIQRDTAMYNLYHEWLNLIENIFDGDEKALYMNFSFIGGRSARYGSWGILETLDQDTSVIYAPKYKAIIDHIHNCGNPSEELGMNEPNVNAAKIIQISTNTFKVISSNPINELRVYSLNGKLAKIFGVDQSEEYTFQLANMQRGVYLVEINSDSKQIAKLVVE